MKKSKLILLIIAAVLVVALVCVVIFCSDGWFKQKWKKVIDGSLYEKESVPSQIVNASGLEGKTYQYSSGELAYFVGKFAGSQYDIHVVYNLLKNEVVFTQTEGRTTNCEVTVSSVNDCAYFVVTLSTCSEKNGYADWSETDYKTTLYDASGNEKATVSKDIEASKNNSFLVFDETYFEVDKETGINKLFEKSPLGKTPSIDLVCGDYYIATEDDIVIVYDKQMKIVSSYVLPGYAEQTGGGVLSDEKLIFQYTVEVDPENNKYDIFEDGEKYDVYTVVFNVKNGKAKEIKCKYIIEYVGYLDGDLGDDVHEQMGINDKLNAIGFVYPIVDQRIDDSIGYIASFDKNGKVKLFDKFEGLDVTGIKLVNTNRWAVNTTAGVTYLVNEKFEVIGDVTEVNFFYDAGDVYNDKYIAAGGKLYDYNLNEVFDFDAEDLDVVTMLSSSVIFKDSNDYYLYNGELTQLTLSEEMTGLLDSKIIKRFDRCLGSNCYGVYDYTNERDVRYIIYNCEGKELINLSVNRTYFSVNVEYSYEDQALISVVTHGNTNRKYNYYVIK